MIIWFSPFYCDVFLYMSDLNDKIDLNRDIMSNHDRRYVSELKLYIYIY